MTKALIVLLFAAAVGCTGAHALPAVPEGYMEPCSDDTDVCGDGLSCFPDPSDSSGTAMTCSSRCSDAEDCPPGIKECSDDPSNTCRDGACYYEIFCQ